MIDATTQTFKESADESDRLWEERFWTQRYHPSVPATIDHELAAAGTMHDLFAREAGRYADRIGFVSLGTGRTYGQILADARTFAAWLQSVNVAKGDRVAIMMPNCLQYPVALFGTLIAGAIVVNVNPLYTVRELEHQLNDSGATVVVVIDMFAATLAEVQARTAVRHVVVTRMGDMLSRLKGVTVNLALSRQARPQHLANAWCWSKMMRTGRKTSFRPVLVKQEDLAFLQYTGGTSGVSKGAMLTHRNVVANTLQCRAWVIGQIDQDAVLTNVTMLPLYHIFSLTANLLMFAGIGGRNVLIANPRDTASVAWILRNEQLYSFVGVNTLFASLLNNERFHARNFSSLKLTIAGGMPTHKDIARRWQDMTGKPVVEGYGLTECSPVVCINRIDLANPSSMLHTGCVGLPVPSTEVRMRRNDGSWAGIDEAGELCVRGPQVMQGYWNRSEETDRLMLPDGWLATGDVGVMNGNGEVRLVDRIKDMILVSGFNVYPSEIENVIADMVGVAEVGVIGIDDPIKGESVRAVIVPREGHALTPDTIIAHCRERLTSYKVPTDIVLQTEPLPKSDVGKVLRRVLRDGNITKASR